MVVDARGKCFSTTAIAEGDGVHKGVFESLRFGSRAGVDDKCRSGKRTPRCSREVGTIT